MLGIHLTPHLKKIAGKHRAIYNQFVPSDIEEKDVPVSNDDPLMEEHYTATRGLIHKYDNRALILLTMNCAAYCRFCTRRRKVSDVKNGIITESDLDKMVAYIKKHPQIKELIFSGGDPLTVPELLKKALQKFCRLPQIKVIRISTRLHVADPMKVNKKVIAALRVVKKQPLYLLVHFEHLAEITKPTIVAVKRLQKVSTMLLSQTVSLKGINDNVEILYSLFSRLVEIGIKPYYFFRCDPVKGAEHFIVDLKKEVAIVTELHKRLSGVAVPAYVVDTPEGFGKVPIPLNFWACKRVEYQDFKGQIIQL